MGGAEIKISQLFWLLPRPALVQDPFGFVKFDKYAAFVLSPKTGKTRRPEYHCIAQCLPETELGDGTGPNQQS